MPTAHPVPGTAARPRQLAVLLHTLHCLSQISTLVDPPEITDQPSSASVVCLHDWHTQAQGPCGCVLHTHQKKVLYIAHRCRCSSGVALQSHLGRLVVAAAVVAVLPGFWGTGMILAANCLCCCSLAPPLGFMLCKQLMIGPARSRMRCQGLSCYVLSYKYNYQYVLR